jgi:hypothetical protein
VSVRPEDEEAVGGERGSETLAGAGEKRKERNRGGEGDWERDGMGIVSWNQVGACVFVGINYRVLDSSASSSSLGRRRGWKARHTTCSVYPEWNW